MEQYVALDVSLKEISVCIIDSGIDADHPGRQELPLHFRRRRATACMLRREPQDHCPQAKKADPDNRKNEFHQDRLPGGYRSYGHIRAIPECMLS